MVEMIGQATGIVLAGGASSRFGFDKALARWNDKEPLVERVCGVMKTLFPRTLVMVKDPSKFGFLRTSGVSVIEDLFPEAHSLGGICSGLQHATTSMTFVCGCDMPHLQPGLVRALWAASEGYDAVVPVWQGRLQPLCGIYSRGCVGVLRIMVKEKRFGIHELFGIVRTRFFQEAEIRESDENGVSFCDIDTQEDFARAKALA